MGQPHVSCCGAKSGQPSVVSIGDELQHPRRPLTQSRGGSDTSEVVPSWLSALAPTLAGEEAAKAADAWAECAEDLRRRTRHFVRSAISGIPCRLIDSTRRRASLARYSIDEACQILSVDVVEVDEIDDIANAANTLKPEVVHPSSSSTLNLHDGKGLRSDVKGVGCSIGGASPPSKGRLLQQPVKSHDVGAEEACEGLRIDMPNVTAPGGILPSRNPKLLHDSPVEKTSYIASTGKKTNLAEVRNIWLCSDSELARRTHGTLRHAALEADAPCVMLIDAQSGPIAIIERSEEAREEFLDCMAVLIATQRLSLEPELACCSLSSFVPAPEAALRPSGHSLQSAHLSGPICVWLAHVGGAVTSTPFTRPGSAGAPLPWNSREHQIDANEEEEEVEDDEEAQEEEIDPIAAMVPEARLRAVPNSLSRSLSASQTAGGGTNESVATIIGGSNIEASHNSSDQ